MSEIASDYWRQPMAEIDARKVLVAQGEQFCMHLACNAWQAHNENAYGAYSAAMRAAKERNINHREFI